VTAPVRATSAAARTARGVSLEQLVEIETPEQVVFSYTVAGIGSRAAAALIDGLVCVVALIVVVLAISFAVGGTSVIGEAASTPWLLAVLFLVQFAILWGYYVLWEGLGDGQTPGKRVLGLRVVQDGGFAVSFSASAVRNLLRMVDLQPGFTYGVGIASAALSSQGKRLGDLVAGTLVVQERVGRESTARARGPAEASAPLLTPLLGDEEYSLLERFVARRAALDADRRRALGARLAERLQGALQLLADEDGRAPRAGAEPPFSRLLERERLARERGGAVRGQTGAAREQHAIVARGSARWGRFADRLASARRRGLAALGEAELSEFVAEYRELATDLARLRTAVRGRPSPDVFYLSRLVAGGHNLLYRQDRFVLRAAWRYLTRTVPGEMRRSARPILLAALVMFGPAAIAYTAVVRTPSLAREFIPAGMIDRAEAGVQRARNGQGYIPDPQLYRPVLASRIIANNVQVTFAVFALGVTAGLGTVAVLVMNGVSLGGVFGLYASKGIGTLLLAFVAPHGVLELTAIAIAGGAGLLLAAALVLPGARTRRAALVHHGRRAIDLIAGSTLLLLVAGTLEGLVSPIPYWPLEWKLAVSAATAVGMALYIAGGRSLASRRAVPDTRH
jgi:uncharacterized membrane protein SpoIIM required for sporulation/uncharacterized RDD family membrane protein YckC